MTEDKKLLIIAAMEYWQQETCIKFRERRRDADEYWVTFRSDSTGCYSFLGRDPSCVGQGQPLSLSRGCDSLKIAAHEIGHLVGLRHQHNRPDRDSWVHINWKNLERGKNIFFKNENFSTFDIPYDYTSLMQYNMWVCVPPVDQILTCFHYSILAATFWTRARWLLWIRAISAWWARQTGWASGISSWFTSCIGAMVSDLNFRKEINPRLWSIHDCHRQRLATTWIRSNVIMMDS